MMADRSEDDPQQSEYRRVEPIKIPAGQSFGQFAYNALRADIQARRLVPGDRVRETDVAERLGISRTPVRDAIKKLAGEGLLERNSARGFFVTQLSRDRVLQIYAMREMLEGAAARFAAEQASGLEVQALRQLLAQLAEATTPEDAAQGNRRLHDAIADASHNAYLLRALGALIDAQQLLGTTTYSVPGRIASGYQENAEIVERIAAHDMDGAENAARIHMQNASSVRLSMIFGRETASSVGIAPLSAANTTAGYEGETHPKADTGPRGDQ